MASILDASAVLAVLLQEPGQDAVKAALASGAGISTANLAEVMTRLVKDGMPPERAERALAALPMTLHELDYNLAVQIGAMFALTRPFGLSLGDRACLALATREQLPALTADRIWARVGPLVGVEVRLIR
jgi:PIN domain nuclease of toxin-antitoxin system